MAGVRRGIPGYANGTSMVPGYADGTDNVPPATFAPLALGNAAQRGPRSVAPVAITPPPPTTPAAPPAAPLWSQPAPAPAFSQILQGQFEAAQQNPNVSPVQAAAAALGQHIQTAKRAADLVNPPSPMEWVAHLFTGTPASGAVLQQRQDTANKLADPLVQQAVTAHPDLLTEAEQNKDAFAQKTTNPAFRQTLQDAVNNHNTVSQGTTIGDASTGGPRTVIADNPAKAAAPMTTHGLTDVQAVAATHPHQLSEDEFVHSMRGVTTKQAQMLFGAQLGHIPTVHDAITHDYLTNRMQGIADQQAKIDEMTKRDDPRERSKLKELMNALVEDRKNFAQEQAIMSGVFQRPYAVQQQPQ